MVLCHELDNCPGVLDVALGTNVNITCSVIPRKYLPNLLTCALISFYCCTYIVTGSNVMKSIHGVGELMTQVVLRGGGLLPTTPTHQPEGDVVKTQTEPEREDILVMDTKLKIIEILQVGHQETSSCLMMNISGLSSTRLIIFILFP